MPAEKNKIVPETSIVFSDTSLDTIIEMHIKGQPFHCLDGKELISDKMKLKSYVHHEDLYILDDLTDNKKMPFTTTIRLLDIKENVYIYKIQVSEKNNTIIIVFQEVTFLADKVPDSVLVNNLHAMFKNTNDYIYFKDRNHLFTGASRSLVTLTSVDKREDLLGKTDYQVFDKELADHYFKLERDVFDRQLEVSQELQPTVDKLGHKAWVDNRKYPIHDEQGNIIGLFGIARIISDYEYKNSS